MAYRHRGQGKSLHDVFPSRPIVIFSRCSVLSWYNTGRCAHRGPCKRRNLRAVHNSRISRMTLDARKFDASEHYYHNRASRINWYVRENLAARICLLMLDAQKFSCAKICTSTDRGAAEYRLSASHHLSTGEFPYSPSHLDTEQLTYML